MLALAVVAARVLVGGSSGARQARRTIVCPGDPAKLGYLAVWAANLLAAGGTLAPGAVDLGYPVGTVHCFSQNEELRLGPVTITRANLGRYAGK